MQNIYTVKLAKPVQIDREAPLYGSSDTTCLYVVASSFSAALEAVARKYPQHAAWVRGVDLINYAGVPIVLGD